MKRKNNNNLIAGITEKLKSHAMCHTVFYLCTYSIILIQSLIGKDKTMLEQTTRGGRGSDAGMKKKR